MAPIACTRAKTCGCRWPFIYPPKFCKGIVFYFSWDIFMSQEKLQTMRVNKMYYGLLENSEFNTRPDKEVKWRPIVFSDASRRARILDCRIRFANTALITDPDASHGPNFPALIDLFWYIKIQLERDVLRTKIKESGWYANIFHIHSNVFLSFLSSLPHYQAVWYFENGILREIEIVGKDYNQMQ